MSKKVVVGMSGGVDSSVAAYLLKKQGYDVIGVTMLTFENGNSDNSSVHDAKCVADLLDIPYYVIDFRKEFKKNVIDYFINEYIKGLTPNPCIACNRHVKWNSLLQKASELDAEYIATGHYAKIVKYPKTNRYAIKNAETDTKDQTYALYNLTQYQLEHTLMPIGEYNKEDIRKIAYKIGLSIAEKPDSQDICFIPDNNYSRFIEKNLGCSLKRGNFIDFNGNIIGQHNGICKYTIGQRKGLGISFGKPMYVCKIIPEKNEIVLGDNEDLLCRKVLIKNFNFMAFEKFNKPIYAYGKIRYSQKKSPCTIQKNGDFVECIFDEPQRAVTPGQAAVFYDGEYILGGGTIVSNEF